MKTRTLMHPLLSAAGLLVFSTASFAQTTVPVVTYNVSNGRPAPATIVSEIQALSSAPPIVSLQEVHSADIAGYKLALQQAYPGTTWTAEWQGYNCRYNAACYTQGGTTWNPAYDTTSEGAAVLTRWTATYHKNVFMTKDRWWLGRAAVLAKVTVPGYGVINVLSGHGPVGTDVTGVETRDDYTAAIKSWALSLGVTGPRFIGADFNFNPGSSSLYAGLTSGNWVDGWADFHGSTSGGETKTTRIDYWISHMDAQPSTINAQYAEVGPWGASDHRPFYVEYTIGGTPPASWSVTDNFNNASIDPAIWQVQNLFSGGSSSAVTVTETTRIEIALVAGGPSSQYNGISTPATRDFENAEVSVELVQAPNTAAADAYGMLTIGTSTTAFYRWWVAGGQLVGEKNVGGGKVRPVTLPYNPTTHRFLRIRHEAGANQVVWETRSASGAWVEHHSETWAATVPLDLRFELKGGTSAGQVSPGVVIWDNFDAHRQ